MAPSNEYRDWVRLALAALPTGRVRHLLPRFQTPGALLQAALAGPGEPGHDALGRELGVASTALARLREAARREVEREVESMERHGIGVARETDLPSLLRQTGEDCPPFLFVRGRIMPDDERSIAIVGTRDMTEYGRALAHRFALEFASLGWTVVSGLARGIDTAAHRGALDGGGRTIAVTGCGLDIVYPSDNRALMSAIEAQGAVLSEWAPGTPPSAWHFPARNRLIAGLCHGTIVIEAQAKSGALITATDAARWGRPVFAVPGNVFKPQSRGPHQLIREGAHLVENAEDVLALLAAESLQSLQLSFEEEIASSDSARHSQSEHNGGAPGDDSERGAQGRRPARRPKPESIARNSSERPKALIEAGQASSGPSAAPQPSGLSGGEAAMWACLEVEPRHLDDLTLAAGLEPGPANAALVMLEIKGLARRLPGNLFIKPL